MEFLGRAPLPRASLATDILDEVKILTTAGGVTGLLAMKSGSKTSDVVDGSDATVAPSSESKSHHRTHYMPYLIAGAVVFGVWYYTRS